MSSLRGVVPALLLPAVLLAGGLGLGACGSDDGDTAADDVPTSSSVSPSGETSPAVPTGDPSQTGTPAPTETSTPAPPPPACADVWVADADLPAPYRGCSEGTKVVRPDAFFCSFGGKLVTYAKKFYARPGHRVIEVETSLAEDAGWSKALRSCTA